PGRAWHPSRPQLLGELVGELALPNRLHDALDVVVDPYELRVRLALSDREQDVAGPPMAVLRFAHRSRVEEVHAVDDAMPGLVRVSEGDHVARLRAGDPRHLRAERVGTVFGPVERVESRRAVEQEQTRPS